MSGLSVPVDAPGLGTTQAGFDRLSTSAGKAATSMQGAATSATKTGGAFSGLLDRLQRGGSITNAAGAFTILAASSGNAYDKIAALSAGLTMVPGPIGIVAMGVTAAASAMNILSRSTSEATDQVAALTQKLAALGKEKAAAQDALAAVVGGAAGRVGDDLRRALSSGGTAMASQAQGLFPGDPNAALRAGTALADSGLSSGGQGEVLSVLRDARAIGTKITDEILNSTIKAVRDRGAAYAPVDEATLFAAAKARDEATARGGGIFGTGVPFRGLEGPTGRAGMLAESLNTPSDQMGSLNGRFARSQSGTGQGNLAALAQAEAPAVADALRTVRDATMADTTATDALRQATDKATKSTDNLAKTIADLDRKIQDASGEAKAASAPKYGGWSYLWHRPSMPEAQ